MRKFLRALVSADMRHLIRKYQGRIEALFWRKQMFEELEFETITYCNRKCAYCPNVDYERVVERGNLMSEQTFQSIKTRSVE